MPGRDSPASNRKRDATLLGALFAAKGSHVSRAELARAADLPARDLEAHLAPYMEAGYPIEFHPGGGIGLHEPPDIWCAEEILGRCPARADLPAWNPLLLAETTSTNDVARQQGRAGVAAGFLAAATHQTKGRGRLGRSWESTAQLGLYASVLLRPQIALAAAGQLTALSSVATADAVEDLTGLRPQIKWPNDILLERRKLAGLLIETEPRGEKLDFAVVGIGLNVRHRREDFTEAAGELATSLFLATGRLYRRADLLVALLHAFERRLAQPFTEVRAAWSASSVTLGQQVSLTTARGRRYGQALGLDEAGALLLRNDAGEIEVVTAGDMQAV